MGIFDIFLDVMEKEKVDDDNILKSLNSLSDGYSTSGLKEADSIGFNIDANRAAYLYLYATCHTLEIRDCLHELHKHKHCVVEVDCWKTNSGEDLKICSIGGGPGCDIVGFLYFLKCEAFPLEKRVQCTVVDKYEGWESTFERCLSAFAVSGLVHSSIESKFIAYGVFERPFTEELSGAIENSDCIIMNKFISAIIGDLRCKPMLRGIVDLMKPGALLIFVDNSGGNASFKIMDVAEEFEMENLYKDRYETILNDRQNDEYVARYNGFKSKRKIDVIIIVWKKIGKEYIG